ncbi:sec-independent protein translocase protein TatB [Rhodobium orientis]|uniref:Sec-independent protein translocase protein TatB n=1 Tax=Rhodobium orientis TaxID=34017 RepID=A0A327JR97_9HYPH|nr:Sec-independent protein translocase protein TatB [Rhodobium orientis]MBB4302169.1 sec-independent protein translocase protein TatB [Rhodobium orientis]MBK5948880.1 twin-arginine translocase subunit TatB [Rhodobium orientis]RAI27933.1 twin-arginine translocase subunit TatB [Rhodobium orientis]
MFDIGWTEILVVAVIAILVVGPKELPRMLRTFGQVVGKMRRMAGEFQTTFNDAVREAERQADLDDAKKSLSDMNKSFNPVADVKKAMNPLSALDGVKDPTKPYKPQAEGQKSKAQEETPALDPVDRAVSEMNPDDGLGEPRPATQADAVPASQDARKAADADTDVPAAAEPSNKQS